MTLRAAWSVSQQQHQGQRWVLCFDDSYLFLVALLATLHAHKTPVIPWAQPPSLSWKSNAALSMACSVKSPWLERPDMGHQPFPTLSHADGHLHPLADDAAIELFTSGSTGQPKRIIKSLAVLDREAELLATHFADRLAGCRIVASVAPQHLYGLTFRIFLPMALGLLLDAQNAELCRATQRAGSPASLCVYQQSGLF